MAFPVIVMTAVCAIPVLFLTTQVQELTPLSYEKKTLTIDYTSEVAYPNATSNNASVRIISYESGVNSCTCVVRNNTGI